MVTEEIWTEGTRVVLDGPGNGPENMARDLAMLRAGTGCRVYSWDGIWVSLGRFQSPERDLVDSAQTRWVRRPTGGKAVLHGHDLTVSLSISLPRKGAACGRSIRSIYTLLTNPVIAALRVCGLPAIVAGTPSAIGGPLGSDCFATASPYDVLHEDTGVKVCGCALRIAEASALLQASIPYQAPRVDPSSLIVGAAPARPAAWNHEGLADALQGELTRNGSRATIGLA